MNVQNIKKLIENSIEIPIGKKFSAIIGSRPSKGARSPLLWNAAFKKMNLENLMIPLDCDPLNINKLLDTLNKTEMFIGGAITAPFKEDTAKWLNNNITEESKKIGAVNCIFRNEAHELIGTNTDGEAAIKSMKKNFGLFNYNKILLMGSGGTAKAITAYLEPEINKKSQFIIIARNLKKVNFHKLYKNVKVFLWKDLNKILSKTDLVINCTTVGWGDQYSISPIPKNFFHLLPTNSKIFDVIYDPDPTLLLTYAKEHKLDVLNGLNMNLEQAVLAYAKVNKMNNNLKIIKDYMMSAIK